MHVIHTLTVSLCMFIVYFIMLIKLSTLLSYILSLKVLHVFLYLLPRAFRIDLIQLMSIPNTIGHDNIYK